MYIYHLHVDHFYIGKSFPLAFLHVFFQHPRVNRASFELCKQIRHALHFCLTNVPTLWQVRFFCAMSLAWAWSIGAWYVVDYAKSSRSTCKEFRYNEGGWNQNWGGLKQNQHFVPYHPCMVLFTYYIWLIFYSKCRDIYHTWMQWLIWGISLRKSCIVGCLLCCHFLTSVVHDLLLSEKHLQHKHLTNAATQPPFKYIYFTHALSSDHIQPHVYASGLSHM